MRLKAIDVATLALNAALYAALGYVFFAVLPLTTPGLGTVRFWPQVVIPAVFAAIFGPWVGGLGALAKPMIIVETARATAKVMKEVI